MTLYMSSSLPLILFNTFIEFLAEYALTQKYLLDVEMEMAKLACLFHWKLWMRYCILPSSWRKGKHFLFLYSKSTVVIPFLLLHNQLLIINSNQCKSITLRRIGEWLSIFIDWLRQSISINRFFIDFYLQYWLKSIIDFHWLVSSGSSPTGSVLGSAHDVMLWEMLTGVDPFPELAGKGLLRSPWGSSPMGGLRQRENL